ncbi:MAG: DNA-binding protein [bacterium (Candidatus Ratteibacteria) CG23_combo_of_CG06-09_8_20_14_all_48_7]|uniref:DNA-binding protein n=1 Tax=bacterium (Candidatus Ratteibacteria) CG23_combo_of_CG06-09_8_20_14_all_48_7 TaxID=2014292 RepID=A0A2G9YB89_9BACT|nr:MAG: DNA-binding protein [bacterium (Candidatus Ratteibacteria) CG23_combo_of_CG06-09_8_20_14_all_48_7]
MNLEAIIDYWITSAEEDITVAQHLLGKADYTYTLFFGHLYLEKLLKALVVKVTGNQAPPIHNLRLLTEAAKLSLTKEQKTLLTRIQEYNVRARYPDFKFKFKKRCTKEFTAKEINQIKGIGKWFREKI